MLYIYVQTSMCIKIVSIITEVQLTNALDFGKVLWNGRYINIFKT